MTFDRVARFFGLLVVGVLVLLPSTPARAHTGFESSTPAAGERVSAPVGVVTLRFTGAPTTLDDGFSALDGDGTVRAPTSIASPEPGVFDVAFDPPLAGGEIGLRWSVRAEDGHVLDGAFAFTVEAATPTTVPSTTSTSTTVATTVAPAVETSIAPPNQTSIDEADDTASSAAPTAASDVTDSTALEESTSSPVIEPPTGDTSTDTSLDEFLAAEPGVAGEGRGSLGRGLAIPAAAVIVGGLAMLGWVFRGSAAEILRGVLIVRVAALALAVGAIVRYSGATAATGESFATAFLSGTERSMALMFIGAAVVFATCTTSASSGRASARAARSLSAARAEELTAEVRATIDSDHRRWRPTFPIPVAIGAALVVVSFWFDGHTVTRGPRLVHAAVNSVHVIAGSVWFAGVTMLAVVAWSRHRRGVRSGVDALVVRFSSIAAVSLVGVVVAGAIMAVLVLDTPSDLWGSPWGRVLVLKTAAVTIAAAVGGYNHLALRPLIEARPGDPNTASRVRTAVTVEAMVLGFVLVTTAALVAAQT